MSEIPEGTEGSGPQATSAPASELSRHPAAAPVPPPSWNPPPPAPPRRPTRTGSRTAVRLTRRVGLPRPTRVGSLWAVGTPPRSTDRPAYGPRARASGVLGPRAG